MKDVLFVSDLDNTLLYSIRHKIEKNICIEKKAGKPQGLMSEYTYENLEKICEVAEFVPVTSRSIEQYSRICWSKKQFPQYALVTNGAILIKDGQIDSKWLEYSKTLIDEYKNEMDSLYHFFDRSGQYKICRMVDGMYLFLYCYDEVQASNCAEEYANKTKLNVMVQGKKLYFLPPVLHKGVAVKRIREIVQSQKIIAAGDSTMDISMLNEAEVSLLPKAIDRACAECKSKIVHYESKELFSDFVSRNVLEICQN